MNDDYKELYAQLDEIIHFYDEGVMTFSDNIPFGMPKHLKQITHYILSRYLDGGGK